MWSRVRNVLRSPQAIAEALREGSLITRDQLDLLLASLIFQALLPSVSLFETAIVSLDGFLFLAQVGVMLHGTWQSFLDNRRGDGEKFIERYICLSTSLFIRFYTLTYLVYLLLTPFARAVHYFLGKYNWITFLFLSLMVLLSKILFLGVTIYIFSRLRSLIRFVSEPPSEQVEPSYSDSR